jgi:micrococcal nuclease
MSHVCCLVVLLAPPARGDDIFTAKVIGVTDGDTITVLRDKTPVKVRLEGIDCPEKKQAFGQRALESKRELRTENEGAFRVWMEARGASRSEERCQQGRVNHVL